MGGLIKTIDDSLIKFFECGGQNIDDFYKLSMHELSLMMRGYSLRNLNENRKHQDLAQNIGLLFSKDAEELAQKQDAKVTQKYKQLSDSTYDYELEAQKQKALEAKRKEALEGIKAVEKAILKRKMGGR